MSACVIMLIHRIYNFIKEPVCLAFLISVILSFLAISNSLTISKDGAFYIDIAQSISKNGLSVSFDRFDWPWYSILIAGIHNLTRIEHELIAYFFTVMFMAGTCSLIVSMVNNKTPEAVYWAVLLVLSIPVFNSFRAEIMRETGFWFFAILAIWLALLGKKTALVNGVFILLSIVFAGFFRLEALFLAPAILVFFLTSKKFLGGRKEYIKVLKYLSVSYLAALGLFFIALAANVFEQPRVVKVLDLINPYYIYNSFVFVSNEFARVALLKWSQSDAAVIVFFGFLAALVLRIIGYAGIVSLILLDSAGRKALMDGAKLYKLNFIAIFLYFIILLVFFFQAKFINSRYSALLLILSVPILAFAVHQIRSKWPRLINLFVFFSLLLMFSNVTSTSVQKTHYIDTAQWIKENTMATDRIYYDDSRVAYYAGRGYPDMPLVTELLKDKNKIKTYDYFVIESDSNDKVFLQWIEDNNLLVKAEKSNSEKTFFVLSK